MNNICYRHDIVSFQCLLGPFLVGLFTDILGNIYLFLVCNIFFIIALILIFLVRRGEAQLTEEQKSAKQKAIRDYFFFFFRFKIESIILTIHKEGRSNSAF